MQAQASQGDLRPDLCKWFRSDDETPRLCRIHNLHVDGTLESAKIMCAFLGILHDVAETSHGV